MNKPIKGKEVEKKLWSTIWSMAHSMKSNEFIEHFSKQYHLFQTPIQSGEERLLAEIAELKAWKESMISVTPDMQEIGKALGVRLGESIHDKILPGIERLRALIDQHYIDWVKKNPPYSPVPVKESEQEHDAKSWLKNEGYPNVMPMTLDNLEIILNRYVAQLNQQPNH